MNAAVKHLVEEALRFTPEELVETLLSRSEPDQEWTDAWMDEAAAGRSLL